MDKNLSFIMKSPLNDLRDIITKMSNKTTYVMDVYVEKLSNKKYVSYHGDMDGNQFKDEMTIPVNQLIKIAIITRDKASTQWSVMIDTKLSSNDVDITMYSRCWRTYKDNYVRDFLNDTYYRVMRLGKYSPSACPELVCDQPQCKYDYEFKFDPDLIIDYINEEFPDHPQMSDDKKLGLFFESIIDNPTHINESSITQGILKAGLQYALGTGLLNFMTNNLGMDITVNGDPIKLKDEATAQMRSVLGQ